MIRINLLGAPKPKSKRGGSSVSMPTMEVGQLGTPLLKVAIVLLLVGGGNYYWWRQLDTQKQTIQNNMAQAEKKNHELADVKARFLERQKQADAYKRRVDVIDNLRANQAGPVNLMNTVGETVNNTEAVWLNNMSDKGASVDIEGMALSTDAVASLIQNLQKTGYFRTIEIKETYQDETFKEVQAFQFTLTCEKAKS